MLGLAVSTLNDNPISINQTAWATEPANVCILTLGVLTYRASSPVIKEQCKRSKIRGHVYTTLGTSATTVVLNFSFLLGSFMRDQVLSLFFVWSTGRTALIFFSDPAVSSYNYVCQRKGREFEYFHNAACRACMMLYFFCRSLPDVYLVWNGYL